MSRVACETVTTTGVVMCMGEITTKAIIDIPQIVRDIHFRDSTPVGITHPVNLGAAVPGKLYTTEFEFDPSLLGEGQYFFYVDVFDGVLTQAVCLDKPVTEFAFEVTSGDLTMPEWAPGWGRIHFPPVKVLENGYDG